MRLYAASSGGFVLHCVLLDVFQFSLELFKVLVHFLYVFRHFGKLPFEFPCPSLVLGDLLQQPPDPPAELPNRLGRRSESGCRGCGRPGMVEQRPHGPHHPTLVRRHLV